MTNETDALVKRLRSEHGTLAGLIEASHKAADRIEALTLENQELRSENARLRGVLRWIAQEDYGSPVADAALTALAGKDEG